MSDDGNVPPELCRCAGRITAITPAFQAGDEGSTPFRRSLNESLLRDGLSALSLARDGSIFTALCRYYAAIEEWNPAYGLVGATGDELIVKHLLDSLAPLAEIRACLASIAATRAYPENVDLARHTLADLGTGAGLPGIPLSLALPGLRVTLIDRMTRRIRFLESMREAIPLPDVEILEEQVERAKGRYDLVTFRAFRPFERKLFKRVFALCAPDGYVCAYKGKADKAEAELAAIEGLYGSARIVPIKVPFLGDERCLVIMSPAAR